MIKVLIIVIFPIGVSVCFDHLFIVTWIKLYKYSEKIDFTELAYLGPVKASKNKFWKEVFDSWNNLKEIIVIFPIGVSVCFDHLFIVFSISLSLGL
jgi:hypothetical protein